MRVLFLGTGEIAIPTFQALLGSEQEVVGLVTQPDKAVGRSSKLRPPAIKVIAEEAGLPVLQPEKIREPEALAAIEALQADLMVVMAYGQILPKALIEMPAVAIINLHASLLPKYRGASCIQSAILNGDAETGWSVMHVVKALDAGDVIHVLKTPITPDDTGESLHDRLAELGPQALLATLPLLESGEAPRIPQDESQTTYAPKLDREDARLDWSQPAGELERRVRALHSWPGSYALFDDARGKEKRLKLFPPVAVDEARGEPGEILSGEGEELHVACGEGSLRFSEVQADGGKRMSGGDFLRGTQPAALK
ncbi:MAG: methionyl-tRNA formyltransferase [Verrucomicrobiota bacterium JB023]|nr:methionyl-tRNA formyltransferase [Verrucomicrobiota bacterium JB023]